MSGERPADGIAAVRAILPVSHETAARLETFVAVLRKWQPAENLISPKTLDRIWQRHVVDSAELLRLFPETDVWLDIGSGAGFPGLILAIAGRSGTTVHLIESNARKCAFLRTVIRETGAPAIVHEGRAEVLLPDFPHSVDRVVSRAVAPLPELLALVEPLMGQGVPAAFHKGEDFRREVADASHSFDFDLIEHTSRVGEGAILEIAALRRKPRKA